MNQTNLIKIERLKRGWTQAQLAEISGLSERTIQRLESGTPPSIESLNSLAVVFEIDVESLKAPEFRIHFSAPLCRNLVISSITISLVLILAELFYTGRSVISVLVLLSLYLVFSVKGYSIINKKLLIHHIGWSSKYELNSLEGIEINPQAMSGSIRLFGINFLFAAVGYFRNEITGKYLAFATKPENSLVLRFSDKCVVITPDNPCAMKASLEANIKDLSRAKGP